MDAMESYAAADWSQREEELESRRRGGNILALLQMLHAVRRQQQ